MRRTSGRRAGEVALGGICSRCNWRPSVRSRCRRGVRLALDGFAVPSGRTAGMAAGRYGQVPRSAHIIWRQCAVPTMQDVDTVLSRAHAFLGAVFFVAPGAASVAHLPCPPSSGPFCRKMDPNLTLLRTSGRFSRGYSVSNISDLGKCTRQRALFAVFACKTAQKIKQSPMRSPEPGSSRCPPSAQAPVAGEGAFASFRPARRSRGSFHPSPSRWLLPPGLAIPRTAIYA